MAISSEALMRELLALRDQMEALGRDIEANLLLARLINQEAEQGRARIEAIKQRLAP